MTSNLIEGGQTDVRSLQTNCRSSEQVKQITEVNRPKSSRFITMNKLKIYFLNRVLYKQNEKKTRSIVLKFIKVLPTMEAIFNVCPSVRWFHQNQANELGVVMQYLGKYVVYISQKNKNRRINLNSSLFRG